MRRARSIAVTAGVLGLALASAATAQSPLGTPLPADQRFEFPEYGIAVSLPYSYINDWASPSLPIFEMVIAAAPLEGPGECAIETFDFTGVEPGKMAETLGVVAGYPEFEIAERLGGVDALPAGDYVRMSAAYAPGGQPGASVAYVFPTPVGYSWLWCSTTDAPPADDWLSIAESVEFLPEQE